MRSISKTAIIILVISVFLVASIQPTRAPFVLASWDFPDEYGQGIDTITVYENSTGSWVSVGNYDYDEASVLDWEVGVAIKLKVWTWFNSTLTGAGSTNEGKNYQRHNVTVTDFSDTIVFSQQNFTVVFYDYGEPSSMWYYTGSVVLNFLPEAGEYYMVTVVYEIFW